MGIRRVVSVGAFAAAAVVFTGSMLHPAVASATYSDPDFEACMNRNMPTDYCCEHAGGVMRGGACIDPETLRVQGADPSSPTIRQLPPGVLAPPATLIDPGGG
jgi:hypothetical protein